MDTRYLSRRSCSLRTKPMAQAYLHRQPVGHDHCLIFANSANPASLIIYFSDHAMFFRVISLSRETFPSGKKVPSSAQHLPKAHPTPVKRTRGRNQRRMAHLHTRALLSAQVSTVFRIQACHADLHHKPVRKDRRGHICASQALELRLHFHIPSSKASQFRIMDPVDRR